MNREQLVEKGAVALFASPAYLARTGVGMDDARTVLDAVLPQVSTAAELEALPVGTIVLSDSAGLAYRADAGQTGRRWWWPTGQAASWTSHQLALGAFCPLTVVWQP